MSTVSDYGKSMSGYWGSPLNKWIDLNCDHEFTNINIDCFQVKLEKKRMRFQEYKRAKEELGFQQIKALCLLAYFLNKLQGIEGWQFEVCIARGDEPFKQLAITDLSSHKTYKIEGYENIKAWLEFKEPFIPPSFLSEQELKEFEMELENEYT